MGRHRQNAPSATSAARERWLRTQLRDITADIKSAVKDRSHQAIAQLRRQALTVRNELDGLLLAREQAAPSQAVDPASLTPEEWAAQQQADAAAASDTDLEVYVGEWLRRKGYRMTVERGALRLARIN